MTVDEGDTVRLIQNSDNAPVDIAEEYIGETGTVEMIHESEDMLYDLSVNFGDDVKKIMWDEITTCNEIGHTVVHSDNRDAWICPFCDI